MTVKHVLIGGCTGFIGKSLSNHLLSNGFRVTGVSRRQNKTKNIICWDDIARAGLPAKVDAVINVAGTNILNPLRLWTRRFRAEVRDSRLDTTKLLVSAIDGATIEPDVFVNISGVGFYVSHTTHTSDQALCCNEHSPGGDSDVFARLCRDWECSATTRQQKHTSSGACRTIILRSGVVLGSSGGIIQRLYPLYWMGLGGCYGNGKQPFPWIHIEDLVRLFEFCLKNDQVSGVLNAVAPTLCTNAQFSQTLAASMRRPHVLHVPAQLVRAMFGRERSAMLLSGPRVWPSRTLEAGFAFSHADIGSACRACVSECTSVAT